MALIRGLASLVLAPSLASLVFGAAGCSQSLFGDPGDGDRDARPGNPDGGLFDGGGPGVPDADPGPPPTGCPAPCVADAVRDFSTEQGGTNSLWLYAEDTREQYATSWSEMKIENRNGLQVWAGGALPAPAIVHCPSSDGYEGCSGVEDKLLFETHPGGNLPTLVWIPNVPMATTYRMSGDWSVSPDAPADAPMTLLVVRGSLFDSGLDERFTTRTLPTTFDFDMDVLPGDFVRLVAITTHTETVPLAVSFYVSGPRDTGACQAATRFDGDDPAVFPDLCGPESFKDNFDETDTCEFPSGGCPATAADATPTGVSGSARKFVTGSSLVYQGEPNDYDGDWTVQFWAYLDGGEVSSDEALLSDQDCAAERGIGVHRVHLGSSASSEIRFEALFEHPTLDRCNIGPTGITTSVLEDEWHFYRLARSTARASLSLCIDGLYVSEVGIPADADISPPGPMWLGRNATRAPARFRGKLADLRVFDRALPCSPP